MNTLELLQVLIGTDAVIATVTVVIYTWVWLHTRPKTWTITGLTALLWSFMLSLWAMRYVLAIQIPKYAATELILGMFVLVGYLLFLYGTWNAGPICKVKPPAIKIE